MHNRKHKLPATFFMVCIIGLIGFKDTGIFVKEYVGLKDEGIQVVFEKSEEANLLREVEGGYVVEKEGITHEVPMEFMIRTTKSTQKYKVINDSNITDKPAGKSIRRLNINEIVQALNFETEYGLFKTTDGAEGYIRLDDLQVVVEDSISHGIAKVDKVLKNDNTYYTLVKGEAVAIKDFEDKSYIVIDEKGNEFKANEDYIEVGNSREKATRGAISRKATSITKVIESAYDALGKPYVAGDIGNRGYDCSGLTYSIYLNSLGMKLNRSSRDQVKNGIEVARENLIPGDLMFFKTTGAGIGHVGLYIGDGNMIHASSGQKKVMISSIDETYYKTRYVSSRRVIN